MNDNARHISCFVLAAAMIVVSADAYADKKSGTLNIATDEEFEGASPIFGSPGSAQLYNQSVYDSLINFDPVAGKFVSTLAESWKRINPTTWEFKLKKGIKFHDGSDFDADDVVYTINWVIDPKVLFRAKTNFTWIKVAEKIDSHTVRIISKRPYARALGILGHRPKIFPSDVHGSLVNCGVGGSRRGKGKGKRGGKFGKRGKGKAAAKLSPQIKKARRERRCKHDFGRRSPIGTGGYRVAAMDGSRGLTLKAVDNSRQANPVKPVPSVKRVKIQIIPDAQTRLAQMLVSAIDMSPVYTKGISAEMAKDPRFTLTTVNGLRYNFFTLDAADRTGVGFFKDKRVRRAIAHAINRDELRKNVVVGGESAFDIKALCVPLAVNCSATVPLPEYDPAKAKKLLAEAGYPNGFKMTVTGMPDSRNVATALSGYLSKVGIKSKIRTPPIRTFIRLNRQNKNHAITFAYGSSTIADAGTSLFFHFAPTLRDFSRDPVMNRVAMNSDTILDPAKRAKTIQDAFDRNNRELFIIPLTGAPQVFVHTKDLELPTTSLTGYGVILNRVKWK